MRFRKAMSILAMCPKRGTRMARALVTYRLFLLRGPSRSLQPYIEVLYGVTLILISSRENCERFYGRYPAMRKMVP